MLGLTVWILSALLLQAVNKDHQETWKWANPKTKSTSMHLSQTLQEIFRDQKEYSVILTIGINIITSLFSLTFFSWYVLLVCLWNAKHPHVVLSGLELKRWLNVMYTVTELILSKRSWLRKEESCKNKREKEGQPQQKCENRGAQGPSDLQRQENKGCLQYWSNPLKTFLFSSFSRERITGQWHFPKNNA